MDLDEAALEEMFQAYREDAEEWAVLGADIALETWPEP